MFESLVTGLAFFALFAAIEGIDGLVRSRIPGRREGIYIALKLAWGIPMVVAVASLWLTRLGGALDLLAVAGGCAVAALALLYRFGQAAPDPETGKDVT